MKIIVNDQVYLSEFREADRDALVEPLNDREIYERTLHIPYPYNASDANAWFSVVAKLTAEQGRAVHFAIRAGDNRLIGGCGFNDFQLGKSHRAEIGYWLAKPYWGRGIMTAVVQRACRHAFEEFGLVKITAHVFTLNPASARVLEKCGFDKEGLLRKHHAKDGRLIDAWLYALIRGDADL